MRCPSGAAAPWHYGMRPGLVQRIIQVSDWHFVLVRINIDDRGTEQVVQILQYIATNSFRNHNMPEIIHSSDNASCFHISFSFSRRERPMCRSCFVLQCGTARRPFPTIILQITLLVSVKGRRLYRKIYFFKSLCYDKQKAVIL